ncbi:hypothetical protein Fcan01_26455 [Folsomia candida]|uniref:Uncharacterized protein n=1 Tax=Folsomia candida TaxID=158441 RepID=A0A226CZN1_FOLCA|nr:hypothetical protein Fcan01_26455 [Folsomia candida]
MGFVGPPEKKLVNFARLNPSWSTIHVTCRPAYSCPALSYIPRLPDAIPNVGSPEFAEKQHIDMAYVTWKYLLGLYQVALTARRFPSLPGEGMGFSNRMWKLQFRLIHEILNG